jgi:hypothetical protein
MATPPQVIAKWGPPEREHHLPKDHIKAPATRQAPFTPPGHRIQSPRAPKPQTRQSTPKTTTIHPAPTFTFQKSRKQPNTERCAKFPKKMCAPPPEQQSPCAKHLRNHDAPGPSDGVIAQAPLSGALNHSSGTGTGLLREPGQ